MASRETPSVRRAVGVAATLTLAMSAVACTGSARPTTSATSPATPPATAAISSARTTALGEAKRLLGLIQVPPGAVMLPSAPVPALAEPSELPASPELLDVHGFWRVPMSMPDALTWFQDHPPIGLQPSGHATGTGPSGTTSESLEYEDQLSAAYNWATLVIEIVPDSEGSSDVRVDGQTIWVPPKTTVEVIPSETTRVSLLAYRGTPRVVLAHRSLTGPDAERVTSLVNDLSRDNRGAHGCSADTGLRIRMTFDTAGGPLVFMEWPACFEVLARFNGHPQPELLDSFALEGVLNTELHLTSSDASDA
jgi:hypothetical protein